MIKIQFTVTSGTYRMYSMPDKILESIISTGYAHLCRIPDSTWVFQQIKNGFIIFKKSEENPLQC